MQRSGGNNGNIYDLRKDLQRPQAKRRPPAALTAAMALMVSR